MVDEWCTGRKILSPRMYGCVGQAAKCIRPTRKEAPNKRKPGRYFGLVACLLRYIMFLIALLWSFAVVAAVPAIMVNVTAIEMEPQLIRVAGYDEIEEKYNDIARNDKVAVVFLMEDSNSYLARYKKDLHRIAPNPENIDDIAAAKWPFGKTKASPKKLATSHWVEFKLYDYVHEQYPLYVPVSACQSQEFGDKGTISFTWTFTESISISKSANFGVDVGVVSISISVGASVRSKFKLLGTVSCDINPGTIGQVLLRPYIVTAQQLSRRMKFDGQRFTMNKQIKPMTSTVSMAYLRGIQVECATNDVVPLFCKSKIGEIDWNNPN